jgi:hypothetical protein
MAKNIKKKLTFYIDEKTENMLIDIFISRLKTTQKATKSDIVCEAIKNLAVDLNHLEKSYQEVVDRIEKYIP